MVLIVDDYLAVETMWQIGDQTRNPLALIIAEMAYEFTSSVVGIGAIM